MKTRGSAGIWGLILAMTVISGAVAWTQLAGLPDLGMLLGPDLTVRHVAVERGPTSEGSTFQRGDRLIALEGVSIDDLRELRSMLPPLVDKAQERALQDQQQQPDAVDELEGDAVLLSYQLLRPVHRFSLALGGEPLEPTELPPGIEPEDQLVEVDGRLMPGVGPEGIRSVAASRPDAVLGIERPDAVFSGQLKLEPTSFYPGVLLAFLLVLVTIGVLWRWHSDAVGAKAAYLIGLETLCLGWIFLLISGFQWVLADRILAGAVIIGLVMMRPLAIMARELASSEEGSGGLVALGIGVLASGLLLAAMFAGFVPSPEEAIHGAALVAGLFIIYELTASSMEGDSILSLGDRGGYLAGVVVLGLFACLVAFVMEPVAFEEDRWRWFAVLLPSLVWFGDVLYGMKYGARSAMGEVADRHSRRKLIRRYLREMALEMPHTDLRVIGTVDGAAMEVRRQKDQVLVQRAQESVADAVEILINEDARVPLPEGIDRQTHPMAGIAKAMNISIAVPLTSPPGSLSLDGNLVAIALVGMRESSDGETPSYASSETLDRAQELWSGPVASAAVIEVVSGLCSNGLAGKGAAEASPALRRELKEARQAALECEEQKALLTEERDKVEDDLETARRQTAIYELALRPEYPEPTVGEEILESELIDGLRFLIQDPEPVVLGGPVGAGKGFVAHWTHHLESGGDGDFLMVDTAAEDASSALDTILGSEGGGQGPSLLRGFEGSLMIRGAQRCDDGRILALCHQCEEKGVRLFLCFDSDDAEQRSVLDERPESFQELLGHREVIIPGFAHRKSIMKAVFNFWLDEWAFRYDKDVEGFSRMAGEALEAYDYPGQVAEVVEVVRLAVVDTEHDVVDRENLPIRVREAQPL